MRNKKTFLIVDDDVLLTGAIQGLLEEAGHAVLCCHDGIEAINLAEGKNFDVILIDYHMPNIKGDAVCRLLRQNYPTAFIIGSSSEYQDEAFLNSGADTFIKKDQIVKNPSLLMQSQATRRMEGNT